MELREATDGDVLVLAPEGNLVDAEDISAIETRLAVALKAKVTRVAVDCAGVGLVSSGAIRVLLMTMRKLERMQGRLILCALSAKVVSAFAISGFDKDFTVVSTRDEAVVRAREVLAAAQARKARRTPPPETPVAEAAAAPAVVVPQVPAAQAPQAPPVSHVPQAVAPAAAPVHSVPPAPAAVVEAAPAAPVPAADDVANDAVATLVLRAMAVPGVNVHKRGAPLMNPDALATAIHSALGTRRVQSQAV